MTLLARANSVGNRVAEFLLTGSTVDLARLMTLLMLLLHGPKDWYVRTPLILLSITGILVHAARSSPHLWFTIAMFVLAHDIVNWEGVDNHKWLMGWWCIALGMTALAPREHELTVIKVNARLLLGLCFAFATIWKLASADYMDSTFFKFELLADSRFRDTAHYVGGAETDDLKENHKLRREIRRSFRKDAEPVDSVTLSSGPRIDLLATAITWWTIFIEGAIALLFLWPGDRLIAILRTMVILVFAATTYLVAPVLGFGWMVIVMGFTQCPEQHKKLRASLLVVLGLLYIYRLKLGPLYTKTVEIGIDEMVRFF
jgi:hypothetical protein